jgi:bleomycin hydrolase
MLPLTTERKQNMSITKEDVEKWSKKFNKEDHNLLMKDIVGNIGCAEYLFKNNASSDTFDIDLAIGDIADQKQTHRCWIYAANKFLEAVFIKKNSARKLPLSSTFVSFYSLLEKVGQFIDSAIDNIKKPLDSLEQYFNTVRPVSEGGDWNIYSMIVSKYGICPEYAMPDNSYSSTYSSSCINLINKETIIFHKKLRDEYAKSKNIDKLKNMKNDMMNTVYRTLCICLGEPPKKFNLRYVKNVTPSQKSNNKNTVIVSEEYGPLEFFKSFGINFDDYIKCVDINDKKYPYYKKYVSKGIFSKNYCFKFPDENRDFFNMKATNIEKAIIEQLNDWQPVVIGVSVNFDNNISDDCVLDEKIDDDINRVFSIDLKLSKNDLAKYYGEFENHYMIITGVALDKDRNPLYWKVANSWGETFGKDGFYTMNNNWFERYVYTAFLNKKNILKVIPKTKAKALSQTAKMLHSNDYPSTVY